MHIKEDNWIRYTKFNKLSLPKIFNQQIKCFVSHMLRETRAQQQRNQNLKSDKHLWNNFLFRVKSRPKDGMIILSKILHREIQCTFYVVKQWHKTLPFWLLKKYYMIILHMHISKTYMKYTTWEEKRYHIHMLWLPLLQNHNNILLWIG